MKEPEAAGNLVSAEEAQAYYRLTECAYRALDPKGTNFMNLGLWPSSSIIDAQANLTRLAISQLSDSPLSAPITIVELGPGWGGSRALVADAFPNALYIGINSSAKQTAFATEVNQQYPNTSYSINFFENIEAVVNGPIDLSFAIEALLHVEKKDSVLAQLFRLGTKRIVLAEICTDRVDLVLQNPLFNPSLKYLWSAKQYIEEASKVGFKLTAKIDLTDRVFRPWSNAINAINADQYSGHARILKQFKDSYSALSKLAENSIIEYSIFVFELQHA